MNKGGCILISDDGEKIALVYRKKRKDYSFPKGHIEEGETILECALRETEEETGRIGKLLLEEPLGIVTYQNKEGKVHTYMYLVKDMGESNKFILEEDKEEVIWINFDEVGDALTYQNLKEFWEEVKGKVRSTYIDNL